MLRNFDEIIQTKSNKISVDEKIRNIEKNSIDISMLDEVIENQDRCEKKNDEKHQL